MGVGAWTPQPSFPCASTSTCRVRRGEEWVGDEMGGRGEGGGDDMLRGVGGDEMGRGVGGR